MTPINRIRKIARAIPHKPNVRLVRRKQASIPNKIVKKMKRENRSLNGVSYPDKREIFNMAKANNPTMTLNQPAH